jgi:hypothetical protein
MFWRYNYIYVQIMYFKIYYFVIIVIGFILGMPDGRTGEFCLVLVVPVNSRILWRSSE